MNVPGFSGRLLGRRNLDRVVVAAAAAADAVAAAVTVAAVDAFNRRPPSSLDVDSLAGAEVSICSGEISLSSLCFGRTITSGFGIRFSKLKYRISDEVVVTGASFTLATSLVFSGLKLSAIRVKLNDFLDASFESGFGVIDAGDHSDVGSCCPRTSLCVTVPFKTLMNADLCAFTGVSSSSIMMLGILLGAMDAVVTGDIFELHDVVTVEKADALKLDVVCEVAVIAGIARKAMGLFGKAFLRLGLGVR